jgi:hypothetical protein
VLLRQPLHPPTPSLHPQVHAERTKVTMVAQRKLKEPKQVVYAAAKINKGVLGKAMKADAAAIIAALESVCVSALLGRLA